MAVQLKVDDYVLVGATKYPLRWKRKTSNGKLKRSSYAGSTYGAIECRRFLALLLFCSCLAVSVAAAFIDTYIRCGMPSVSRIFRGETNPSVALRTNSVSGGSKVFYSSCGSTTGRGQIYRQGGCFLDPFCSSCCIADSHLTRCSFAADAFGEFDEGAETFESSKKSGLRNKDVSASQEKNQDAGQYGDSFVFASASTNNSNSSAYQSIITHDEVSNLTAAHLPARKDASRYDRTLESNTVDARSSPSSPTSSNNTAGGIIGGSPEGNGKDPGTGAGTLNYLTDSEHTFLSPFMSDDFALAPASQIAYFYLHKTLGLSDETMWKITVENGCVLGLTVVNLRGKVDMLRNTMDLTDEDIRVIIGKQPNVLQMSADGNLAPTMSLLRQSLALSKDQLRSIVVQYPSVLCYSMRNIRRKIGFFKGTMAFSVEECRELLVGTPQILTMSVDSGLTPRWKFLHREMRIPMDTLRGIVLRQPRIFLYSLDNNLREKLISFFIMRLGMEPHHVQKVLTAYPLILDYSLEDHMLPIARYFLMEVGFSAIELRTILVKFPRLMTYSLARMKHVVGYLRFELGLDADHVKRVLYQAPQVICLNTESNLKMKVAFLRDTFMFSSEESKKVIAGMPTLLNCNPEKNLRPKAEYLLHSFDNNLEDLREAIVVQPTLMGYSLEKRIKPRLQKMKEKGLEARKITTAITLTEEKFLSWLSREKPASKKQPQSRTRRPRSRPKRRRRDPPVTETREDKRSDDRSGRIVTWSRRPDEVLINLPEEDRN